MNEVEPWRLAKCVIHEKGNAWRITWHGVMGARESGNVYHTRMAAYEMAMLCGAKDIEVVVDA